MDLTSVIVVSNTNTSIKNNIATSISHIYSYGNGIKKTIHYTINVSLTKMKLFAIRYIINQAVQIPEVFHLIIITDTIHSVKRIFDFMIHPY